MQKGYLQYAGLHRVVTRRFLDRRSRFGPPLPLQPSRLRQAVSDQPERTRHFYDTESELIVMSTSQGPVVQRAILTSELVRIRKEAQRVQEEVARALDWSPSKLIRIE